MHSASAVDVGESSDEESYIASVNRAETGEVLGIPMFLGADDLSALGIGSAVDRVDYRVCSGAVAIEPRDNEM